MNDSMQNPPQVQHPPSVATGNTGGGSAMANTLGSEVKAGRSIDFLLDIPLEITVEIGRRTMTMGELIELTPGTVVELDRSAEEYLDIMANGKLVARGEAVMVGDRYGVRVMEIVGDNPF